MRFIAQEPITHADDGETPVRYEPGAFVEMSTRHAAPHVASGALIPDRPAKKGKDEAPPGGEG